MTDYIKQVAEAAYNAGFTDGHKHSGYYNRTDLSLIIASVPKPYPAIWMRHDELQKAKVSPYLCHGWNERDKHADAVPLYTYPPDALDEIYSLARQLNEAMESNGRLIADAAKREAFIDELVKQRHAELSLAVNLGWEESGEGWNDEYCPDRAKAISDRVAIVERIEQERGE